MPTLDSDRRSLLGRLFALPAVLFLTARRASAAGKEACTPTESDFRGPMYEPGAPRRSVLAGPDEPGERLRIRGTVFGPDCRTPLPKTLLDVWQADARGEYHDAREQYRLRGQILTDARGGYELDTVRPGRLARARARGARWTSSRPTSVSPTRSRSSSRTPSSASGRSTRS